MPPAVTSLIPVEEKSDDMEQGTELTMDHPSRGAPTLLVVDDDPEVREIVSELLESEGMRVLQAGSGEEAILVATRLDGRVDLVITDVRMPGMNGVALARYLNREWPAIRILYMSGYAADVLEREGSFEPHLPLLAKPFTVTQLMDRVRELLEAPHEFAH